MYSKCQDLLTSPEGGGVTYTFEQMNITSVFQQLWIKLSTLMRGYIYASLLNTPNVEAEAETLFQIPVDFRNDLLLFYGPEIADRLNALFINFLSPVAGVLEGYKTNNQELVNQSVMSWYQSANELAKFLDSINLFWDAGQWQILLYQYISLKLTMITAIASGDYQRETQIYDRVFDLTSIMGTYMARGLIAQQLQQRP